MTEDWGPPTSANSHTSVATETPGEHGRAAGMRYARRMQCARSAGNTFPAPHSSRRGLEGLRQS
jgi:hypothetical protein